MNLPKLIIVNQFVLTLSNRKKLTESSTFVVRGRTSFINSGQYFSLCRFITSNPDHLFWSFLFIVSLNLLRQPFIQVFVAMVNRIRDRSHYKCRCVLSSSNNILWFCTERCFTVHTTRSVALRIKSIISTHKYPKILMLLSDA